MAQPDTTDKVTFNTDIKRQQQGSVVPSLLFSPWLMLPAALDVRSAASLGHDVRQRQPE